MEEIWKPIIGYEEYYLVSDRGKIKSLDRQWIINNGGLTTRRGRVLRPQCKGGYLTVNLYDNNGKMSTKTVHRLVAIAFLVNNFGKKCVNHLDLNKKNNNVYNLEWCTHKENSIHAYPTYSHISLGKIKKINDSKMNNKAVIQMDKKGNVLAEFESVSAASVAMVGKVTSNISAFLNKNNKYTKSAYGFIWKFKVEEKCLSLC